MTTRRLLGKGRWVDLSTKVGDVVLPNPVMTASGTAGHGAELSAFMDLAGLGAVVVKSLSAAPWKGNPAPRVHEATAGMVNSVGLQNPGVDEWLTTELPDLVATGARVVASIWGFTVEDVAKAAAAMAAAPSAVVAVEVNLSCPNVEDRRRMFAHSTSATAEVVAAAVEALAGDGGRPVWAKLSPNVTDITEIAAAAAGAGASAVTLVNTLMGMAVDAERWTYRLGSGRNGGGLSGPAIKPVALRAVHDVHAALPSLPIVGVGGVASGVDAAEMLLCGASAVQVGTATFADPRTAERVVAELAAWCRRHDVRSLADVVGAIHDRSETRG